MDEEGSRGVVNLPEASRGPMIDEIRGAAIDLAWLGVPALIAIHVATAERVSADHFVTADAQAAEWASMRGLATVLLS